MPYRAPSPLVPAASIRLELLRLLLVLQVVLGHFAAIGLPPIPTLDLSRAADLFVALYRVPTRFGPQAAVVFICMSGFLLLPRLLAIGLNRSDEPGLGAFLSGRLRRIYPTLVAAVFLTAALDWIGISVLDAEPLYRRINTYDSVAAFNLPAMIGNLLSLQPTFAGAFGTNGPLWTLGYIVQFYIAGAALAAGLRRDKRLAFAMLAGLLLVPIIVGGQWSLLFGCWLLCGLVRWFAPQTRRGGWTALVAGIVLFVGANRLPGVLGSAAAGLSGVCFLLAVLAPIGTAGLVQLPRPIAWFNSASYALYAMHYPVAVLLFAWATRFTDPAGLSFRVMWPITAFALCLAVAALWQLVLRRIMPERTP